MPGRNNAINARLFGTTGTGQFVGDTSPTIVTPVIAQINDANGNPMLGTLPLASAVNYIAIGNNVTGGDAGINAVGSDPDVGLSLASKGSSGVTVVSASTTIPFNILSGTSYQHNTQFLISNTAATRNITFPDVSGNVALSTAPTTVSNLVTYTSTDGVIGQNAATAINGGNIQAGLSGTAGSVSSFPAVVASGSLNLTAVTNTSGNFGTTISNDSAILQSQTISVPDVAGNTGKFILNNSVSGQRIDLTLATATPGSTRGLISVFTDNTTIVSGDSYALAGVTFITDASGGLIVGASGKTVSSGTISGANVYGCNNSLAMVNLSSGVVSGSESNLSASGTLSGVGTSIISGASGRIDLTGGTVNGATIAPLFGHLFGTAPTQTNMTNTSMLLLSNVTTAVLNSQIFVNGDSQLMFEISGATTSITTPTTGVQTGPFKAIKVSINGTTYLMLASTSIA